MRRVVLVSVVFAAVAGSAPATVRLADVTDCVPADTLLMVAGRPIVDAGAAPSAASQPDSQGFIQQLLVVAAQLHLLPPEARVAGDVAGTLPLLGRYPYAFALLDITGRPLPSGGHRLAQMQAAMIFDTGGDHRALVQRIRQLLVTYTNSEVSRLEEIPLDGGTRYRLIDSRLPPWTVIEWGPLGPYFVVSIGEGAWDRILATYRRKTLAVADDPWYIGACLQTRTPRAFIECLLAAARMRERLANVLAGGPNEVLRAIQADKLDRSILLVGFEGRAVTAGVVLNGDGRDHLIILSESIPAGDNAAEAVPPGARRYGFTRQPLDVWARGLRDAYLAIQGEPAATKLRGGWARLEEEYGFSAERDLLAHLGVRMVVHDYPLHPLRIPLLWTYLIEIDGAEADVRRAVNGMMRAWQAAMAAKVAENPETGIAPQIRRTGDGIWFIHLGLAGPAVAVTPRWIVIGFSPEAVRENLRLLRTEPTSRPATTTAIERPRSQP